MNDDSPQFGFGEVNRILSAAHSERRRAQARELFEKVLQLCDQLHSGGRSPSALITKAQTFAEIAVEENSPREQTSFWKRALSSLEKLEEADLTQLAKKNGGNFPTGRVTRILDGSEAIPAHGSAKQPVWGHVFGAGEYAAGGNPGPQTVADQRIQLIMQYLETIQEK